MTLTEKQTDEMGQLMEESVKGYDHVIKEMDEIRNKMQWVAMALSGNVCEGDKKIESEIDRDIVRTFVDTGIMKPANALIDISNQIRRMGYEKSSQVRRQYKEAHQ